MGAVDHRFALGHTPALPSACSKKSLAKVSSPILACSVFTSTGGVAAAAFSAPNTPAAPSRSCAFHWVIWLGCTSNCCANSARVFSPLKAARATLALKAGEWFRRGLLLIASPVQQPLWLLSGRNSTYPAVQISRDSSYLDLFGKVALSFRTRLPRNSHKEQPSGLALPYRVLLDKSVSPDIWYGYGDPAVTHVPAAPGGGEEDWYYLLVTSNDAPNAFPILRSRSLSDWELSGFVFPEGRKPSWTEDGPGVSDYWAPEMHAAGGQFLVCFAAREKGGSLAIGLARSSRPEGPFVGDDVPLVTGGVIDPHLFVDRAGRMILFWKEDSNDVWPSLLSALLHEHAGLVGELFPSIEDQRTASLVLTIWPWVRSLEPMERFLVQQ